MSEMRNLLAIGEDKLEAVNRFLTARDNPLTDPLFAVIDKFGGPESINEQALAAGDPANLRDRLKEIDSPYLADLDWLAEQIDRKSFVDFADWCDARGVDPQQLNHQNAVTLEISALQFFPWLIAQARKAIDRRELMPGRVIRVRNMGEQSRDQGDIMATACAMRMIGATWVETLDTKGTDGSNIHLGGPETITGYFGGIGQPNDYALRWVEEALSYYTAYGTRQVLNINPGTVLLGYLLNKLGVDNEFKISVFMGNDNSYSVLWTLMTAKLFSRPDDTTSLIGFNLSNSVNNQTIKLASHIRRELGLEHKVRFEHHVTETWKSIVRQPYLRRDELVELAREVPNISAKHEGGDPEVERNRTHPSDVLDYFMAKDEIVAKGLMEAMEINYLDKHEAVNRTAEALVKGGTAVVCAPHLHLA
jgi:hypothetical protein